METLVKHGNILRKKVGIKMNETKEEIIKRILEHEEQMKNRHNKNKKKYIEILIDRKDIGKTQKERDEEKC